jgi:hypothetical protein
MLTVLNKRWLSQGWRAMDPKDSEPMAVVFIEALNDAEVPYRHYDELYRRAVKMRAQRYSEGLKCDDFSVDMMIACWPSLRREIRQQEIDTGRTLTANAESICRHCLGTGWRPIDDSQNAAVKKCDHSD